MIIVDYEKCCWEDGGCNSCSCDSSNDSCEGCVEACPTGAITREEVVKIDESECSDCGRCVLACPNNALNIE